MYVHPNFITKKALKEAVDKGENVEVYQPGIFSYRPKPTEDLSVEGPHWPEPHKWYARVRVEYGKVVKVLG